jgi:hypothetical protein
MRYARPRNRHSIQLILFERTGFRATTPAWPAPPTRSAACSPPSAARRPTSGMPAASHGGATATRKPPADVTTSTNNYKITKCGCNKAFSSNHVTVRPPRLRHPHRAARRATRWSPRPPSASLPAGRGSGLLDGGAECPCGCLPQQLGQLGEVRRDDEQLNRDSARGVERPSGSM